MSWQRVIGVAIVLIAAAGAAAGGYFYYFRTPAVKTNVAMSSPVSEVVLGTGTVEPVRWAKVVPLFRKPVVELCRCEGQQVKQGQVLGRQDDAEERAALQELEIRRDQLDRDLKRLDKDRRNGVVSKAEYERQESQLKELNSRVTAQKERLETLVFRSPMDGMVLRRDGEVGEIVGPTDVLFWVGQPLPLYVVSEINEEEITKVAVGQKSFLRNDAFPSEVLPATVSQVTPKGDPTRKTFRVYLQLPNNTPLRIGMSVEANIVVREKPAAVVVPAESILNNSVQVVTAGKVHRVPIKVEIRGARLVEVIGEVNQGAVVVSPAQVGLTEGEVVRSEPSPPIVVAAPKVAPGQEAAATSAQGSGQSEDEVGLISAAMSAHIQSVVADARRNVGKFKTSF